MRRARVSSPWRIPCYPCQQKTHFCLPTKVRFLNDVCLRQMMTATPNDARFANDVCLAAHWANIASLRPTGATSFWAKRKTSCCRRRCIIWIGKNRTPFVRYYPCLDNFYHVSAGYIIKDSNGDRRIFQSITLIPIQNALKNSRTNPPLFWLCFYL